MQESLALVVEDVRWDGLSGKWEDVVDVLGVKMPR